ARGRNDQKLRRSAEITYLPPELAGPVVTATAVLFGHTAPALIHASRSSISESFSLPPEGILSDGSTCFTALIRRLFSGSPTAIADPRLPPVFMASRLSSRKPPSAELVWHP